MQLDRQPDNVFRFYDFNQPFHLISENFFDNFEDKNKPLISSMPENGIGILGQNLYGEIKNLIDRARKEKGEKFATELKRYIKDDLQYFPISGGEEDYLLPVKEQIIEELLTD